ncbi:rhamnulokinase [Actinomyces succiniciruminis]|uniref:Rhamnulokinase n=1 Tax=Actinomyces succiniciruminis TaxID=1522002 RepID=A0A1L7RL05_9ACTO|nr:rhamnulokinase family protein [Actinomyces succiniciruminis]CED89934.1 Rhamnulokinase [Actinomyces succiniciruminis]
MTNARPIHVGAVDLGASSGRVMVGTIADGRIELTETRRFANGPIPLPGPGGERLYWDVLHLWDEIRQGLLAAVRDVGPLSAVGIDTWGVDYGLLGPSGLLAGQVSSYRCPRTRGVPEEVFAAIPAAEMYSVNGLQVQDFNTLFQLVAESRDGGLPRVTPADGGTASAAGAGSAQRTMLLLPDLFTYWLTGRPVAEITNASTTGLVDARARTWSVPLLERLRNNLGVDLNGVLPEVMEAGTVVGPVRRDVVDVFDPDGRPTPVVAVGSHDTASAVAAVPAAGSDFAYISCGTWSLVGLELGTPVLTEASRAANFTNELGVDGTVRYLKNVMGLWVFNEAVRTWREQGLELSYRELDAAAEAADPLRTVVDINDPIFFDPGDMAARIDDFAIRTGQPRPRSVGEYVRCIDDSLALAYRRAVREASDLSGKRVGVLHMVGGGISNRLLCQLAADATGLKVVAGPAEGTALGNIVVAARGAGLIEGDLTALRKLVRASCDITEYAPDPAAAAGWDAAERQLYG